VAKARNGEMKIRRKMKDAGEMAAIENESINGGGVIS
jgi:hypothetical protein